MSSGLWMLLLHTDHGGFNLVRRSALPRAVLSFIARVCDRLGAYTCTLRLQSVHGKPVCSSGPSGIECTTQRCAHRKADDEAMRIRVQSDVGELQRQQRAALSASRSAAQAGTAQARPLRAEETASTRAQSDQVRALLVMVPAGLHDPKVCGCWAMISGTAVTEVQLLPIAITAQPPRRYLHATSTSSAKQRRTRGFVLSNT